MKQQQISPLNLKSLDTSGSKIFMTDQINEKSQESIIHRHSSVQKSSRVPYVSEKLKKIKDKAAFGDRKQSMEHSRKLQGRKEYEDEITKILEQVRKTRGSNPCQSELKTLGEKVQKQILTQKIRNQYIKDTLESVQEFSEYNPKILKMLFYEN